MTYQSLGLKRVPYEHPAWKVQLEALLMTGALMRAEDKGKKDAQSALDLKLAVDGSSRATPVTRRLVKHWGPSWSQSCLKDAQRRAKRSASRVVRLKAELATVVERARTLTAARAA